MSKATVSALLLAAFSLGCAVATVGAPLVVAPARAGTTPTRWEYACVVAWGNTTEVANKYGAAGWEMATAGASGTSDPMWCFKRALP